MKDIGVLCQNTELEYYPCPGFYMNRQMKITN